MLACSPMVNSRIRLRMSSSTSVISERLMSGSTSCSRVLIGNPPENERAALSECAAGTAGRIRVGGGDHGSWNRRSFDDVLDHRVRGQPVAGGVRTQPEAVAEHVLREILDVFRVD